MNLAYRDVRHNPGRFLLTCLGIALLLGVVLGMIGIYRGLVADALTLARESAADIWVVESGTRGPFAESSRIPGDSREAILRIGGVASAGAVTYQAIESWHRGAKLRLYVVGYELGRPGGPDRIVEGRGLARAHYELVADRRSGLRLGEFVALGRNLFRVVGLTENMVATSGDPVVFLTLGDSQELQFELAPPAARQASARGAGQVGTDTVNAVLARLDPNASVDSVAAAILRWKHLAALSDVEQEAVLTRSLVERARQQIGMFATILLIVATVIISLIVYTLTMDKLRAIATLKLIGAPNGTIVRLILEQALAMGVIGFGLGASLVIATQDYFPRRIVLFPEDALGLGVVIVAVSALASGLGVRLALKVDPATALSG
jgi:putative ABC transport system permease protein